MRRLQMNPEKYGIDLSAEVIDSEAYGSIAETRLSFSEHKVVAVFTAAEAASIGRWFQRLSQDLLRATATAKKRAQKEKREGKAS